MLANLLPPEAGQWIVMAIAVVTAVLVIAEKARVLFFAQRPRGERPMERAEVERELEHRDQQIKALTAKVERLCDAVSRLAGALERQLKYPFRNGNDE